MADTFSCIRFALSYFNFKVELAIYKVKLFLYRVSIEADAINDRCSVLCVNVNVNKLTSFFSVFMTSSAVTTNVT